MSDLTVFLGTKIWSGKVAPQPQFGAPNKGGIQYHLESNIPDNSFYNTRPLK